MPIFTKDQFAKTTALQAGTKGLRGVVNEVKAFSKSPQSVSIFLSHCHDDKNIVEQVVTFLRTLNATIYIDWMDQTLPEKTNGNTATAIKSKILLSNKFIFLATNASMASKWCNWEIGIGDAYKLHADN